MELMGIGRLFTSQLAAPLRVRAHLGSGEGLVAAAYAKKGSRVPPRPSWARGAGAEPCPGTEPHPLLQPRHLHPLWIAPDPSLHILSSPGQPCCCILPAATGCEMLPLPPGNPHQNHTAHPTAPDLRWDRGWDWTPPRVGFF